MNPCFAPLKRNLNFSCWHLWSTQTSPSLWPAVSSEIQNEIALIEAFKIWTFKLGCHPFLIKATTFNNAHNCAFYILIFMDGHLVFRVRNSCLLNDHTAFSSWNLRSLILPQTALIFPFACSWRRSMGAPICRPSRPRSSCRSQRLNWRNAGRSSSATYRCVSVHTCRERPSYLFSNASKGLKLKCINIYWWSVLERTDSTKPKEIN